jgi:hypothetical protein
LFFVVVVADDDDAVEDDNGVFSLDCDTVIAMSRKLLTRDNDNKENSSIFFSSMKDLHASAINNAALLPYNDNEMI